MTFINFLKILEFKVQILSPFINLFLPYIKGLANRYEFEMRNLNSIGKKSYGHKADVCLHVSSEGEFEQVRPIMDRYLQQDLLVELIYTSPSLESKIVEFTMKSDNLRSLRLPIVTQFLGNTQISEWVTANRFYMCRYDFFPQLLLLGLNIKNNNGEFGLIWATLKDKDFIFEDSFSFKKWLYENIYRSFTTLVVPSDYEAEKFKKIGINKKKIKVGEFRLLQINLRLSRANTVLEDKFRNISEIKKLINKHKKDDRLIFGSGWEVDLALLNNPQLLKRIKQKEVLIFIVPHDLHSDNLANMKKYLKDKFSITASVIRSDNNIDVNGSIYFVEEKGILCELYSFFGHAYVGGGFGRSIHSVLEPFLANCLVYCGPKVHRSTEFDYISKIAKDRCSIVNDSSEFIICGYNSLDTKFLNELSLESQQSLDKL